MLKVGDWVVRTDKYTESIYKIISIKPGLIRCAFVKNGTDWKLHATESELKHATPDEIAAGHRIDNNMGDDTHIENHVSPLCKVGVK